ncbi:MAG: RNA polymerase sigma factor [Reichenbachiella sp.]|uniref:RNA polymerase sigma factor n=1 Tax=Reichenbachiella sp. TaxID=2184521 RepID=UPI003264A8DE
MTTEQFKKEVLSGKNKLYRYALSIVCNVELAEDIVQEVFMKLWNQREKLSKIHNIEAWSMTLTRNQCLDKLRKKKLQVVDLSEAKYQISGHQVADHLSINNDLMEKIESTLALLPEKQREIFRLRELLGYSNQEIEKILNLDDSQVKVYLFRARQKVRASLSKILDYGVETNQAAG